MGKAWLYLIGGLLSLTFSFGSFLWLAFGPEEAVERSMEGAFSLFNTLMFSTPLGLLLLIFGFFAGGGASPKDGGTTAAAGVAGAMLLGSKKDIVGF
uniref:Uncharacterized protein n=1 Tax=Thermus caliditerrae TaxID=1330700 RepID=A0A7C5RF91_9DEIN